MEALFLIAAEEGTRQSGGLNTDGERKQRVQDLFVYVHFGELLGHLFERIDMILCSYINSPIRNPFRDTLERVNKDVHCSIIYSDKVSVNLCWRNGLEDKELAFLCKYIFA